MTNSASIAASAVPSAKAHTSGRLKIFFGACGSVGKTYAMLDAGHQIKRAGADVVVGAVEAHGRKDVEKLLDGMPVIPLVEQDTGGVKSKEFDLDIALLRKPQFILIDELAHTNAPGSRHPKRWNDIEELLANGINVYATLNVENIESLSDVVAGITGTRAKETVPDSVFDNADDIILVDINADELLRRMRAGKFNDNKTSSATADAFLRSNIIALRELALRRTIERVDAQMEDYRNRSGIKKVQPAADKIMVCIGPEHLSEKLIRTAKRTADSLHAPWLGVYVENARHYRLSEEGKKAVEAHIRMVESLGGRTIILQGTNAVDEIINYAQENAITKIVIGKQARMRWRDIIIGSLADKVIRRSGYIDVYVVTSEATHEHNVKVTSDLYQFRSILYWQGLLLLALCTVMGIAFERYLKNEEQMAIYLIGSVVASAGLGRGPSFLYAILSAACYNFFFVEPMDTLDITDQSFWMTAIVMLVTNFVISSYASRLRLQARFARRREHDTQMLYAFTREMVATRGHEAISRVAASHIKEAIGAETLVALPDKASHLEVIWGELPQRDIIRENGLMRWSYDNAKMAGNGTDTMPSAQILYVPLITSEGTLGVLGIMPKGENKTLSPDQISLMEAFASLLASGIERANAAEAAIAAAKAKMTSVQN